jgi:polysaccharide biosynthesis protein PslG
MSRGRWAAAGFGALGVIAIVVLVVVLSSGSSPTARHVRTDGSTTTATSSAVTSSSSVSTAATLPPPATTPLPARPAPAGEEFGANVNLLFNGQGPPPATIAARLSALRATGATVARSDAFWEASEPIAPVGGRHNFVWTFDDQIATALATAGLRWLPVLDYSAPWAQSIAGQDHSPPRSAAEYAAYAEAFAARYGSGGSFWKLHPQLPQLPVDTVEIWNEPDNAQFWTPQPNAAAYAGLYAAARTAIQTVDPSARVIIGGLTKLSTFLPAMVAAMPSLRGHIDGIAVHPYGTPRVALGRVREGRDVLRLLRMNGVPLYATEFGWTTRLPGALDYVPAPRRPRYIIRTLAELDHMRCGLAAAVIYTWYSPQQDPSDSQQWYGLTGPTSTDSSSTAAFTSAIRAATAAGGAAPC